jgi:hypothetical protein
MSTTLRTASLCIAAALLAACGRDAVEQKLVGTWQTAVASPTGAYELRFTTQPNGQYRTDALGAAAVAPEFGYLRATGGKWLLQRPTGSDEGTYEFVSADSVLFKSKTGVVLWTRLANDAAAGVASTPRAPSPGPASPVVSRPGLGAGLATLSSGTAEPSAALLATGPFGPALEESAAAIPESGGAASGASVALGFAPGAGAPATAGFAPAVQSPPNSPQATLPSPSNQPAATAGPLPTMTTKQAVANVKATVHQTASQTAATAKAGAQQIESQAATSTTDAVNGAAAETNKKVGQKIGAFAGNVGSKIKNFFTGGKRQDADSGNTDSSAQPPDGH